MSYYSSSRTTIGEWMPKVTHFQAIQRKKSLPLKVKDRHYDLKPNITNRRRRRRRHAEMKHPKYQCINDKCNALFNAYVGEFEPSHLRFKPNRHQEHPPDRMSLWGSPLTKKETTAALSTHCHALNPQICYHWGKMQVRIHDTAWLTASSVKVFKDTTRVRMTLIHQLHSVAHQLTY